MKRVFVDSSVLFSAANSPSGGSSKLFTIDTIHLVSSRLVLTEVEWNVRKKLHGYHFDRFLFLISLMDIITSKPSDKLIQKARDVIAQKDAVILAEAKQAKHFLQEAAMKFLYPKKIVTPKMLIERVSRLKSTVINKPQ
ncbi:MAG: hypothetical protein UW22_C0024G0008 [Candidatus Gottesmanbacteria bacterium GW2011_GWB1_44_11c]|uniref:PIN domain-containing protein n=1 Tax=Candidatus Gottesmanbacteria bacterium GW2011_GWB1_44_11c TaxID=1618447 RepID=A0A0G1GR43_9BACT|nr:MAG: hypothetical protein UW22_C0024G0008 [Candidatus Gottesmanbacteria bacterium GW2011_GWB1_44_11c]